LPAQGQRAHGAKTPYKSGVAALGPWIALPSRVTQRLRNILPNPRVPGDSFDIFLLTELQIVKSSEDRLRRLFPKLRLQPRLQEFFLQELAEVRQRADRLNAILNSFDTLKPVPVTTFNQLPAA
jgi:hypothetical protein